jgi:hypothetical protein
LLSTAAKSHANASTVTNRDSMQAMAWRRAERKLRHNCGTLCSSCARYVVMRKWVYKASTSLEELDQVMLWLRGEEEGAKLTHAATDTKCILHGAPRLNQSDRKNNRDADLLRLHQCTRCTPSQQEHGTSSSVLTEVLLQVLSPDLAHRTVRS